MNNLFIEFRDPLFGIIVFFVIVFIIAFFSYWWGRYKLKEDHRHLDRFIRQFHSLPTEEELQALIGSGAISEKSWVLLAHAYYKNGDFEKSIEIYQALIARQKDPQQRRDTLFLLGQTYFKAGFLERAKNIFLQILSQYPRTPQALRYLLLVYEQLREFDKALEVLEPLDELGNDAQRDRLYLECRLLLQNPELSEEQRAHALVDLYTRHHALTHLIFDYLFTRHSELAWRHLDLSQCDRIGDILWRLPKDRLDLDIISQTGYLRELFTARGDVDLAEQSDNFELDLLISLRRSGYEGATLQFEFFCHECKQVFPFAFHRCPCCNAIDSIRSEMLLTKEAFEENLSFQ